MFLVLGIWAKALTGSNSAAGLVFFVLVAPSLLSPFAGLVVDRMPRRPLLIGTNVALAASMLLLLLVHDRGDLWLIYLVAALYGFGGIVLYSARSAFMTVMLPRDLLADANAIFQSVREGLRLIAPIVGASLYAAFGGGVVALLDAVTFLVVAAAVWFVRTPEVKPEREQVHFLSELTAGIRHVLCTSALRQIVLTTGVALLVIGFAETLIFAVIDEGLHRPPAFLGVLEPAQGVGAIAGGLTAAAALRRVGDVRLVGVGVGLFGLGDLTFVSSSVALIAVGFAVAGFGLAWAIVGFATSIQLRTPERLQGRVASAADTMISTPQTVSIALGATLVTVIDYRALVVVMTVVLAACGVYLLSRQIGDEALPGEELADLVEGQVLGRDDGVGGGEVGVVQPVPPLTDAVGHRPE
jgi:MFS family permease